MNRLVVVLLMAVSVVVANARQLTGQQQESIQSDLEGRGNSQLGTAAPGGATPLVKPPEVRVPSPFHAARCELVCLRTAASFALRRTARWTHGGPPVAADCSLHEWQIRLQI
jgi:hypothetical protein